VDGLEVIAAGPREFEVLVGEGTRATRHVVRVPDRIAGGPALDGLDLEALVRESFAFLLEREPPSSILGRFSLDDITRYFPEYPREIARRLGR
jgi:hypothetical protein